MIPHAATQLPRSNSNPNQHQHVNRKWIGRASETLQFDGSHRGASLRFAIDVAIEFRRGEGGSHHCTLAEVADPHVERCIQAGEVAQLFRPVGGDVADTSVDEPPNTVLLQPSRFGG